MNAWIVLAAVLPLSSIRRSIRAGYRPERG
jgi:hypothetical protein